MNTSTLKQPAKLIGQQSRIAEDVAGIIGRPAEKGHVGEYNAAETFSIKLNESASAAAMDGHFLDGSFVGRSVNVKWYAKRLA